MAAGRNYDVHVYVDGNTVRKLNTAPAGQEQAAKSVSMETLRNRERSTQMNLGYVLFLACAAVLTVMICVNYLRLQARYTSLQKQGTRLETTLGRLKLDNDEEYNRIVSGVNLEHVRTVAMQKLGMVYASQDQIVLYDAAGKDYVKQYQDIPGNR